MKFRYAGFYNVMLESLPSRERGLKYYQIHRRSEKISVAPFAGAWIEIGKHIHSSTDHSVAPFAGAWIEIQVTDSPLS